MLCYIFSFAVNFCFTFFCLSQAFSSYGVPVCTQQTDFWGHFNLNSAVHGSMRKEVGNGGKAEGILKA